MKKTKPPKGPREPKPPRDRVPVWPELRPGAKPVDFAALNALRTIGARPGAPMPGTTQAYCSACIDAEEPCATCSGVCMHQIVDGKCVHCGR